MEEYRNLNGNSGVDAYEIGNSFIRVRFNSGYVYLYTIISAGADNIQNMISLAEIGKGLNAYINKNVKFGYDKQG